MGRANKMFRFAVVVCSAALVAAEAGYTVLGYSGLGYAGLNAPTAYNNPAYAANPLAAGLDHVGFGLGYDARAIASGSRAAGVIGGQSTLGHSSYSAFGKREAEAEPYLGYAGLGYSGLGYGYAGAYGYGKSAPCVNAANFPVPCRGFY